MKKQLGIIVLIVLCVGLVIALIVGKKQADMQRKKDVDTILDFSNQLTTASSTLDELRQVNLVLTNDLDASRQALVTFSNQYIATSASLSNAKTTLETTLAAAQAQIADLKVQNQMLDQRAARMSNNIASLSAQIVETRMKLVESETNNMFLGNELERQVAKKAELERELNDLSQVRAQFIKLRDDSVVVHRLEWARERTDPTKQQRGAQLLMTHASATTGITRPLGYSLNVEVGSEGSVKVVPAPTNTPAVKNLWRW